MTTTTGIKTNEYGSVIALSGFENLCMTAGSDGTWYCYDMGIPIGSARPDQTNDGQTFYAYR